MLQHQNSTVEGCSMEGLLQHQNSTVSFQRNYKSCMLDWLRILRKLVEDSSHGGGRQAGRAKIPRFYAPLRVSKNEDLDDEANFLIVEKGNETRTSSGKALVRSLLFKKLFRKQHQKQRSSKQPRLTRTYSIHHLECNDYVLQDSVSTYNDTSKIDFISQKTDSSQSNGLVPLLPGTRKFRSCGTMKLKHLSADQAKLVEELQNEQYALSNNAQTESLVEVIQDQDLVLENCLKDLRRSSSGRILRKTGSFKQHPEKVTSESLPSILDENSAYYSSDFIPQSSLVNHFKNKLKDTTNENRKEHLHISLDGIMDKIPYGERVSGDATKEKLFRSASARSYRESSRGSVSIPPKVHPHQKIRRSHSLTDSSDVYSHNYASISTSESKRLPESLMLLETNFGLRERNKPEIIERIHSNHEFKSSSKNVTNESLHGVVLSKAAPSYPLNKDESVDISLPTESKLGDNTLVNMEASVEPDTILEHSLDGAGGATIDEALELQLIMNELTENNGFISLPKQEPMKQQESHNLLHGTGVHEVSDLSQMSDGHVVHENGLVIDSTVEPIKPSVSSVLDLVIEGDLLKPEKYDFSADSEMGTRSLHFEEPDIFPKTRNSLGLHISDEIDASKSGFGKKVFADADKFCTHVDQKDEADFNYIRNALRKSSFNGFDIVDPILTGELWDSFDDVEVSSYDSSSDVSADHPVLSDLMNEILLELSERFSIRRWFSRFNSCIQMMRMECNVLEEVWKKAKLHLSSQAQSPHFYEHIVARDILKDEGWLNLQQDALCIGTELESRILDDLLDDLILEYFEDIWDHLDDFVS
ncbi:hypothetical protein Cni_G09411 [Canna indica]|uniref:DUF4378 domain-containing protein n=1 Tax=Canna indica TaxID=4628 RepID=A0AAQ3K4R4_9LILI|nr:hypothetical protein Cni_G09411 [Canna indica]